MCQNSVPYPNRLCLLGMCQQAKKDDFEIVVVAKPEILGDNYDELLTNLRRCAQVGRLVAIADKKAG